MTVPTPGAPAGPAKWKPLDARQRRVLGVLIEKAKTTPAAYPMTVNAVVTGCNQKNNRDPLTAYDDTDVEEALRQLQRLGVVTEIDWMGRVPKYKHLAYEWFEVGRAELAVLAELLLRGAQQLGELRARADRMETIADLAALKPLVDSLVARRLIVELTPAGRGQMVTHGVYPPSELAQVRAAVAGGAGLVGASEPPAGPDPATPPAAPASPHRRSVSSGSPFEPVVGISRAVRIGNQIAVAGTAPLGPDGRTVGIGDAAAQARRCFEISERALEQLGAGLKDVIRTRILLTRIEDWEAVARVHGEFFGEIRPVSTVVQVTRFIDPEWLIETEVDAVV